MRAERGITLVALVITIIVLLILATVTISLVINGGIIQRANNAVTKYNAAAYNEQNEIDTADSTMQELESKIP